VLRVAMIGLGAIATKAYLPVLAGRGDLRLHLCTRDPERLATVGDAHRLPDRHRDLDSVLAAGVDAAFVHAATAAHPAIVARLLDAGVHVYVDKPLADSYPEAERLVGLARRADRTLFVGFNRRYAPAYAALRDLPRELVLVQKHRTGLPAAPRAVVFDDFIHVVDTVRFLAPGEPDDVVIRTGARDGLLHHAVLQLAGAGWTAIGAMHRVSGSTEEIVEVAGCGRKRLVRDLAEVVDHVGVPAHTRRGDWTTVEDQRGFSAICEAFLASVRENRVLDAGDALRTHELCERIVERAEAPVS
jgi:virulence factor